MTDDTLPTRAEAERAQDNSQRRWVESIRHKSVGAAAEASATRGHALLVWIDANGELRAQRIVREDSTLREFIPDYLQRRGPR